MSDQLNALFKYLYAHIVRGPCCCGRCVDSVKDPEKKQPEGHTAELVFFKVSAFENPKANELKHLLLMAGLKKYFDNAEHSYLEIGADLGSQDVALQLMGLGQLLGLWSLNTPCSILGLKADDAMAKEMAGLGYITIQTRPGKDSVDNVDVPAMQSDHPGGEAEGARKADHQGVSG